MSRINLSTRRPIEYFLLVEPQAAGPVVGYYAEHPIADVVVDCFGRRFTYAGIAPRLHSGRYNVEALLPGEWIVEPGLVYYGNPGDPSGPLRKLRDAARHAGTGAGR